MVETTVQTNQSLFTPLCVQITGAPSDRPKPGWSGVVEADSPFATLLTIRDGRRLWWAKSGVNESGARLLLRLHGNGDGTAVQLIFSLGCGVVADAVAGVTGSTDLSIVPSRLQFDVGQWQSFCQVATEPPSVCELFFLSRLDVCAGDAGVWSPHERLQDALPPRLAGILWGTRRGFLGI